MRQNERYGWGATEVILTVALLTAKSWLILLPPKVGSQWIVASLRAAGVPFEEVDVRHAERAKFAGDYAGVATFVRHPVDWHASYWAYRNSDRSTWDDAWELDAQCASPCWKDYVTAATSRCPGYVARMFSRYTEQSGHEIDFVGKQEYLRADLTRLLDLMGETFDPDALRTLPVINASPGKPVISAVERSAIHLSEQAMYARYGYEP